MHLDIRVPIGLMFLLIGGLLLGYGALGAPPTTLPMASAAAESSWGAFMVLFGALMLALARRQRRRGAQTHRH